jgi:YbbR domain-containing protein
MIRQLIFRNWQVKTTALLVTLVLFGMVRINKHIERDLSIHGTSIEFQKLAPNYLIENRTDIKALNVNVKAGGQSQVILDAEQQHFNLVMDMSNLEPGNYNVVLTSSMLQSKSWSLRRMNEFRNMVHSFTPAAIPVNITLNVRSFPLNVIYKEELPSGMVVAATRVEPESVELTGTSESLRNLYGKRTGIGCTPVIIKESSQTIVVGAEEWNFLRTTIPSDIDNSFPDVELADPTINSVTLYYKIEKQKTSTIEEK